MHDFGDAITPARLDAITHNMGIGYRALLQIWATGNDINCNSPLSFGSRLLNEHSLLASISGAYAAAPLAIRDEQVRQAREILSSYDADAKSALIVKNRATPSTSVVLFFPSEKIVTNFPLFYCPQSMLRNEDYAHEITRVEDDLPSTYFEEKSWTVKLHGWTLACLFLSALFVLAKADGVLDSIPWTVCFLPLYVLVVYISFEWSWKYMDTYGDHPPRRQQRGRQRHQPQLNDKYMCSAGRIALFCFGLPVLVQALLVGLLCDGLILPPGSATMGKSYALFIPSYLFLAPLGLVALFLVLFFILFGLALIRGGCQYEDDNDDLSSIRPGVAYGLRTCFFFLPFCVTCLLVAAHIGGKINLSWMACLAPLFFLQAYLLFTTIRLSWLFALDFRPELVVNDLVLPVWVSTRWWNTAALVLFSLVEGAALVALQICMCLKLDGNSFASASWFNLLFPFVVAWFLSSFFRLSGRSLCRRTVWRERMQQRAWRYRWMGGADPYHIPLGNGYGEDGCCIESVEWLPAGIMCL